MRKTDRMKLCRLAQCAKNSENLADRLEAIGGLAAITEYLFSIGEISLDEYKANRENLISLDSEVRAVLGLKISIGVACR